ncbi:MAG TPA: MarR family transcriptional regulator [Longimicrobium sp.]|nr:MarR family transcriptional regulator [Longimicrobium sp.]
MSRLDEARQADGARSPAGDALTDLVIRTFRLNGLFLAVAELMARPAGLTAARWQVLGAVLREPLTVSDAARAMGLTRQSVQRLADALVADGMAEFIDNPRHRRARLLRPTQAGWDAIGVIRPLQHAFTHQVTERIDAEALRQAVAVMDRVIAKLEDDPWRPA